MAAKRTLAQKIIIMSRAWKPSLTSFRVSSSMSIPPIPAKAAPAPGDAAILRRFLQERAAPVPVMRSFPGGDKLLENLRGMDAARDRIPWEGLCPSPAEQVKLTVEEARKLLRVSLLEVVKSKLRKIPKDSVSLAELVHICSDCCGSSQQGMEFAKILDDSGAVIVFGDVVFLKPDQVVKQIQELMPAPAAEAGDPRWRELEEMEKQKAAIARRAEYLVRRELWCGLGYLVVQTAAFVRLTFWELTWDVMEPICFYVTSAYFMAGYAFFLRTSKEPSFEGFFQSRFTSKQQRLMEIRGFDASRYVELRRSLRPPSSSSFPAPSDGFGRTDIGALH